MELKENNSQVGFLISEIDAIYHEASVKLQLSDSALQILYALCLNGNQCLLSDITKLCGISRKTIHSSIKKLERDGVIGIEPYNKRNKRICLTEAGVVLVTEKIVPLVRLENEIIRSWQPEEQKVFLQLMKRYYETLKEGIRSKL